MNSTETQVGARFHRLTVAELKRAVAEYHAPLESRRLRESALNWKPLYERLLEAVAETMEEGWPFQRYPEGWSSRARSIVFEVEERLAGEVECHYPQRADSNFGAVLNAVSAAVVDPSALSGREVGLVRAIMAQSEARHGKLLSPSRRAGLLLRLKEEAGENRTEEVLERLSLRLEMLPEEGGLSDPETLLAGLSGLPKRLTEKIDLAAERSLCELSKLGQLRDLKGLFSLHGVDRSTTKECLRGWLDWLPWLTSGPRDRQQIGLLLGETGGYFAADWEPQAYAEAVEPLLLGSLYARYYGLPEDGLRSFIKKNEANWSDVSLSPSLQAVKRDRELRTLLGGDLFALRLLGIVPSSYLESAVRLLRSCETRLVQPRDKPYPELLRRNETALAVRQLVGLLSFCSMEEIERIRSILRSSAPWCGEPWTSLFAFLDDRPEWSAFAVWQAGFGR